MGKYFSATTKHEKALEFLELRQGTMTVMEYVARFTELAPFADDYVATYMAKIRRFENELKLSIRVKIVGLHPQDMDSMVGTAMTIEREIEDARGIWDVGASGKRKESQSSSSSGKKPPVHVDSGKGQGCQSCRKNGMFSLQAAWTYEEGFPLETRIPEFKDSAVPINCEARVDTIYSSTPWYGSEKLVSVPRSYTRASRYTGRPEGPDYGSR